MTELDQLDAVLTDAWHTVENMRRQLSIGTDAYNLAADALDHITLTRRALGALANLSSDHD